MRVRPALSIVALAVAACARSAETRPDSATADVRATHAANWPADSTAILAALASLTDAWNRGDAAAHLAVYDDSATFVVPTGPGKPPEVLRSVATARPSYVDQLKGAHPTLNDEETLVLRPLGGDAAVFLGRYTLKQQGRPDVRGISTLLWSRTPAGWRIVLDHSS